MADVSVRPAGPGDVTEISRIQVETWRQGYQDVLPAPVLAALDPAAIADGWRAAVASPPSPRHHVVIAQEGDWTVGFAAFSPDPDALDGDPGPESTAAISVLLVEPRWGRRGHGSRLLAAVADLASADGADRLIAWVPAADTSSLQFYRSAGWEADGVQRSLDTGAGSINELRLHASLGDPA
ncbi:GNAT family N-acetyltransferase [Jatrophihabitans telluris]|uniref:GNAT family N-acetyltransferase n=1 Tax=Jatrophihabitans telluris TaxID=2038343 RepID=A0ABY4QSL5_9ACTN|nr:GNAT family N-acetyltransferase [Jatrophihabitans telluris]UQX86765.1 GNAT family N-acetyltransferase [Jatrophihabitans telluris]